MYEDLVERLDQIADDVRAKIAGNGLRAFEYKETENQALQFQANGYTGTVPMAVQTWSDASGMTPQAACDNILQTAAKFNYILMVIRQYRLLGKYSIPNAQSLEDAQAIFDDYHNKLKALLPV